MSGDCPRCRMPTSADGQCLAPRRARAAPSPANVSGLDGYASSRKRTPLTADRRRPPPVENSHVRGLSPEATWFPKRPCPGTVPGERAPSESDMSERREGYRGALSEMAV